jgi:GAF domain-containing protein
MKEVVSDKKEKPVLDEQTFARLLEAAYVLQEHHSELGLNLELRAEQLRQQESDAQSPVEPSDAAAAQPDAHTDYSPTLAQIVETQRLIQIGHLDLAKSMALIAKRVAQITKSGGAAIAIVEGKTVQYRAGSGSSSLPCGTDVPMEKALCFTCFRTGKPFSCPDVNPEFLLDAEECHRRGIQSLIAVPVYHDGGIAGALELYFAEPNAFSEPDVHTCQLMAGLITEALARDSQGAWKESQAAERASILAAVEKLKPNLEALLDASSAKGATTPSVDANAAALTPFVCRKCGHDLVGEEQFCGKCGSPRISERSPSSLQSKVASLQRMKEASQQDARTPENGSGNQPPTAKDHSWQGRMQQEPASNQSDPDDLLAQLTLSEARTQIYEVDSNVGFAAHTSEESTEDLRSQLDGEPPVEARSLEIDASETGLAKTDAAITWSSAAQARDALEELAVSQKQSGFAGFWNARRADIYLAIAVILMAGVIRWGLWSNHSVNASRTGGNHRRQVPDADLSVFDKLLIGVGLAEAPDAPEYKGNPETQVWVDLHTALYYCPNAGLYGKTPKGKFTTQRDAQLDQFEPAYRKACD